MKKLLLTLIFAPIVLFADIKKEIASSLKTIAIQSKFDVRILYTIASVESNFEPYIISFLSADKEMITLLEDGFKNSNCNFRFSKYDKTRYAVSISSKSKEVIINIADVFWDMGFNIDFGIMQISKQNMKRDELADIFDPSYNITKSAEILDSCYRKYGDMKNSIECYNKGFVAKKKYNYYAKFEKNFDRFFGEKRK